ncbi:porin family protein [Moritella marina ATCC 15381]|uniref:Porin family protein n=1 Tax=Moritella marina ATCC 15381 TaxID=1202962 RepID=A0A5J6WUW9_MORMI|nr:porin family protein [Moritella marina ATCC 15381]
MNETVSDYFWSPTAASLSANLGYTFRNGLRPFGVIGVSSIELGQPYLTNLEDDSVGFRYGFGLEYAPEGLYGLSARVGYEIDIFGVDLTDPTYNYTEVRSYTLSSFYVSASYKF